MLKTLTTIALLALPSTALAADLVGDPPNLVTDPGNDWGFYIQGYGGVVTQNQLNVLFDFGGGDTESFIDQLTNGPAFGFGAGVTTPIDGLSVGLDVMHAHQSISAFDTDFPHADTTDLDSLSVFGTVEGAYHLSPMFDVYASGGLGATIFHVHNGDGDPFDVTDADTNWTPAYEVAVGVRANVTENLSVFTEVKHTDVFSPAQIQADLGGTTQSISYGHNAVTAGVRFNF